ncbi:MAG: cupin domain-containing protein [Nevskia sp.]|nr:cupin domain-containing protein [Nevskia sp.]
MSAAPPAQDRAARLGLEPHPEGGYFRRIYTAPRTVGTSGGERPLATSIYYLLDRRQPLGRLHRNRSDILHFLVDGGPLEYLLLDAGGVLRRQRLGPGEGEARFLLVPGGCWKASQLLEPAAHALVAEVVTPGFDYADHEFAREEDLRREHPAQLAALARFVTPAAR